MKTTTKILIQFRYVVGSSKWHDLSNGIAYPCNPTIEKAILEELFGEFQYLKNHNKRIECRLIERTTTTTVKQTVIKE